MVADASVTAQSLREWSHRLIGEEVIYFPVRHHSPGCAHHLRLLIAERRPSLVLVEGPTDFDRYVDLLTHADAKPPLALYAYCNERAHENTEGPSSSDPRARRGAYYPFCEYSPEWVAIRDGRALGAEVRFIDLTYPRQLAVDHTQRLSGRVATLLGERHFERSAYLRKLAEERGCRNQDELWDRLFEAWAPRTSTAEFIAQVATYCWLSRAGVSDAEHEQDGTTAREAEMARHVGKALKAREGNDDGRPVLVVTGGYHTVVLPELVAAGVKRPKIDDPSTESGSMMIRYSFDRLDRMNGYSAGMPQPAFYQRVWNTYSTADRPIDLALDLITDVAMRVREENIDPTPSTATLIAAHEQAQRLAQLRGNPSPTRTDILDAVASCFAKGSLEAAGTPVLAAAMRVMSGNAVGTVPKEAGLPPIVDDFYREARKVRLRISDTEVKKVNLDVYRDAHDQRVSRLLHVLEFLEVPFATRISGPDFTAHQAGRRLIEIWEYGWAPQTEASLIDTAADGNTLREAAAARFLQALQRADESGESRSAAIAARFLSQACVLGLHELTSRVLVWLRRCVREDPSIVSLSRGLAHLVLLWESREPLGATGLQTIPELAGSCMERACFLMHELPKTASTEAPTCVDALVELNQVLKGDERKWFDADLFWSALQTLPTTQPCEPMIAGAAAGVLYVSGRWSEDQLAAALLGRLAAHKNAKAATAFFRGIAVAAREALWQSNSVLDVLRQTVEAVEETEFMTLLPELRLAFTSLTPRETDRFAAIIAGALGVKTLGPLVSYEVNEATVQRNLQLNQQVAAVLRRDLLEGWLPDCAPAGPA